MALYLELGIQTGLISFPGGIPVKNADGEVISAIGVSGSTVENDHAVAEAGANSL
ncbi:heme-binding protein [Flavobacterium sp.]|uniref:heme-binding protein n=1 Tax=Flavobacterium sp. TaxID=239 RepID=UPI0038FC6257